MNTLTWVTELSTKGLEVLKAEYKAMLVATNMYDIEEIEEFMEDLMNEKLGNLEDAVGIETLNKIVNM